MRKQSFEQLVDIIHAGFSGLRWAFVLIVVYALLAFLSYQVGLMQVLLLIAGIVGWYTCSNVLRRMESDEEPAAGSILTAEPRSAAYARAEQPVARVAVQEKPAPQHIEHKPKGPAVDWEAWMGKRLLQIGGVLIVLIGVVVLLKQAFENRWIDELGRLLLATGVAGGLLLAGDLFRKKYAAWAQTFTGGGLALLYFVVWAAHVFYADILASSHGLVVGPMLAFALYIGITLIGALFTWRYKSQPIAWFTMIGGYITPLLIVTPDNAPVMLAAYLFVLGAGMLFIARAASWRPLELCSFVLTQLYLFALVYTAPLELLSQSAQAFVAVLFFLLFALLPVMRHFTDRVAAKGDDVLHMIVLCVCMYFPVREAMIAVPYGTVLTSLMLAAVLLLMGVCALKLRSEDDLLINSYLIGTFFLIGLALYSLMGLEWVAAGWAVYSVALLLIGLSLKRTGPWHCAIAALAASLLALTAQLPMFEQSAEALWQPLTSTWSLLSYVVFGSVIGWIILLKKLPPTFLASEKRASWTFSLHGTLALLLLVLVTFEATSLHWTATLTLSYAYLALAAVAVAAFVVTGVTVWFALAFAVQLMLIVFTFFTGEGTSMLLFPSAAASAVSPLLHPWMPVSILTVAMVLALVFAAKTKLPKEQNIPVYALLWAVVLAQVWLHGTVEIRHAAESLAWTDVWYQRALSLWWVSVAVTVLKVGGRSLWGIVGVALLAIPEAKDLLRLMDGNANFLETVVWTVLPFGLLLWAVRQKQDLQLKVGIALIVATMAADTLGGMHGQSLGLAHSIWWAFASLMVMGSGFVLREAKLRKTGMVLFGATAVKLLLLDFSTLATPIRVGASMATGLLMIAASYLYQRFDSRISSSK